MRNQSKASKIAYPALLCALSLVFVYIGSVVPSGNWGFVALAGLFPAAAVISVGLKAGFLCWGGATVLSFILLPGKFCALLYGALFGLYPMIKYLLERIRRRLPEYILKLAFFNLAFTLVFLIMRTAVFDSLPTVMHVVWLIYLVGNIVFLIYDFGFSKLITFYIARIGRAIN